MATVIPPKRLQERLKWLDSTYVYLYGSVILPPSLNKFHYPLPYGNEVYSTKFGVFSSVASPYDIRPGDVLMNLNGVPDDQRFVEVTEENIAKLVHENRDDILMQDHKTGKPEPQYLLLKSPEHRKPLPYFP